MSGQDDIPAAPPLDNIVSQAREKMSSNPSSYARVEPTLNFTKKGMPTTLIKFWGIQIIVGIIMYVVIILIMMYFGQRTVLGNVLAILAIIMGNTYMVTKFQNLDGCYKQLA